MTDIRVKGGVALRGEITPIKNKNSILPSLIASVLSNKLITYKSVPKSTDVLVILEIIKKLGGYVDDNDFNNLKINCENLSTYKLDEALGIKLRSSIMFAGPLLARMGVAEVPLPGGCILGKRSIGAHLDMFNEVGIKTEFFNSDTSSNGWVRFTAPQKLDSEYFLWPIEASVTATENFLMYAAGTQTSFRIENAASEPHVTDLLGLLEKLGATIQGKGSNRVYIKGTKVFNEVEFEPGPDHIDIAGLLALPGITKGELRIKGANIPEVVNGLIQVTEKFGVKITRDNEDLIVNGEGKLEIDWKNSGIPLAAEGLPKITPRPWPGYPVDAFPALITLATKTNANILLKNWMYETGLDFVSILGELGANLYKADAERVIVFGPSTYKGGEVSAPDIIEACKAIFYAALADNVETHIKNVDILYRRYPNIFEEYKKLGANIEVIA